MPSNIDYYNNILSFLEFIDNDIKGSINCNYFYYLIPINNLVNNFSYEVTQYNNFINNSTKNYPNLSKLKDLINMAKNTDLINFHRIFCVYLWFYIYH
jgi:hypothetical protein